MLSQVVTMPRVIRVMPNTPCMVLQGSCGKCVSDLVK